MHVLLLHNATTLDENDPTYYSDYQVVDAADAIEQVLRDAGRRVTRLALGRDWSPLERALTELRPDVTFNLFEGLADDPCSEWQVAALLEDSAIPFTGCPARTLKLGGAKHAAKRLLALAGVRTPHFALVRRAPARAWQFKWPAIVKPATFDASLGIDGESVVANDVELARRVELLLEAFGAPVLVEEFVFGREFSLTIRESCGLHCLPPREFRFESRASLPWPILTYAAKWAPWSDEYQATPVVCGPTLEVALARELEDVAKRVFRLFDCRDIARVDVRVDDCGAVYVLEINPNPDLSPAGSMSAYTSAGLLDYATFITGMADNAAARGEFPTSPHRRLRRGRVPCPTN